METEKISFGQSYLDKSLHIVSPHNLHKLRYVYDLGNKYPMDIYIKAKTPSKLEIFIKRASAFDYVVSSSKIPITEQNLVSIYLQRMLETLDELINGKKFPFKKFYIRNLNSKSEQDVYFTVTDEINKYESIYENRINKYLN